MGDVLILLPFIITFIIIAWDIIEKSAIFRDPLNRKYSVICCGKFLKFWVSCIRKITPKRPQSFVDKIYFAEGDNIVPPPKIIDYEGSEDEDTTTIDHDLCVFRVPHFMLSQ